MAGAARPWGAWPVGRGPPGGPAAARGRRAAGGRVASRGQGQGWGLGGVAAVEYPQRWGGLVDVPAVVDARAAGLLAGVLGGASGEDQAAVRGAGVLGRRMVRAPLGDARPARPWQPSGTVLITGGARALGAHVAPGLARRGAPHPLPASPRGPAAPRAAGLEAELLALGTQVTLTPCDITSPDDLARVAARLAADGCPVRAVFHTAAVITLAPLEQVTAEQLAEVVAAKAIGAEILDEVFGGSVDAFVLFSSIAGLWGSGEHGAYAAANAHLDALAEQRHARGLPATSIAWGVWSPFGVPDTDPSVRQKLSERAHRHGLPSMDPALGIAALAQALDHDETSVAIADIDWERFASLFTMTRPSPLFAALPEAQPARQPAGPPAGEPAELRQRLAALPPAERHRVLLDLIRGQAAAILGHASPDAVEDDRAFQDLGFDSLTAVEFRNRLSTATGLQLPVTIVFDHPTPTALTQHLRYEILQEDEMTVLSVHTYLDTLEARLPLIAANDTERAGVTVRLRSLLQKWTDTQGANGNGSVAEELESANDAE